MTPAELSRAAGFNLATLQDVERAPYDTTIVTLVRIAEGLGVSLDRLFRRSAIRLRRATQRTMTMG